MKLGGQTVFECSEMFRLNIPRFWVPTGEFRTPKKGERYISGAIPVAYLAPNDLRTEYHIAEPLDTEPEKDLNIHGLHYRLQGPWNDTTGGKYELRRN